MRRGDKVKIGRKWETLHLIGDEISLSGGGLVRLARRVVQRYVCVTPACEDCQREAIAEQLVGAGEVRIP
jgi:hypothetical protein